MDHTVIYILTAVLFILFYILGYLMGGRHALEGKKTPKGKGKGKSNKISSLEASLHSKAEASSILDLRASTTSISTRLCSQDVRLKNLEDSVEALGNKLLNQITSVVEPIRADGRFEVSRDNITLLNCGAESFDAQTVPSQGSVAYAPKPDQTGLSQINKR